MSEQLPYGAERKRPTRAELTEAIVSSEARKLALVLGSTLGGAAIAAAWGAASEKGLVAGLLVGLASLTLVRSRRSGNEHNAFASPELE